jgi:uncharacterized metal-binding protein YceD (DUF177 family)
VTRPWSEVVRLDEIGRGLTRTLTADEATRARIARFLELDGLEGLSAEVTVAPAPIGWRLSGRFAAVPVQSCGVTLEPFENPTHGDFSIDLVGPEHAPTEDEPGEELSLDSTDPPDVVEDEKIDLAAYVVEQLSLALDPFPRKPDAEFVKPDEGADLSPFAQLAALKRPG